MTITGYMYDDNQPKHKSSVLLSNYGEKYIMDLDEFHDRVLKEGALNSGTSGIYVFY